MAPARPQMAQGMSHSPTLSPAVRGMYSGRKYTNSTATEYAGSATSIHLRYRAVIESSMRLPSLLDDPALSEGMGRASPGEPRAARFSATWEDPAEVERQQENSWPEHPVTHVTGRAGIPGGRPSPGASASWEREYLAADPLAKAGGGHE